MEVCGLVAHKLHELRAFQDEITTIGSAAHLQRLDEWARPRQMID